MWIRWLSVDLVVVGVWLMTYYFKKETSYDFVYPICGFVFFALGIQGLLSVHKKYPVQKSESEVVELSKKQYLLWLIPFIIFLPVNIELLNNFAFNLDAMIPFYLILITLGLIVSRWIIYLFYIKKNKKLKLKSRLTVYLVTTFWIIYILTTANSLLPASTNETRILPIAKISCNSRFVKVEDLRRERYYYVPPSVINANNCNSAKYLKTQFNMNILGVDYANKFYLLTEAEKLKLDSK